MRRLLELCKCGVYLDVNWHRNEYKTIEQALEWVTYLLDTQGNEPLAPEIIAGMRATGNIVHLQCYPRTPICFYSIWHFDLDTAIALAVEEIEKCDL